MCINGLFEFIKNSPTSFHAVDTVKKMLIGNGYSEIQETDVNNAPEGKYFVIRNGSSLIAFKNKANAYGFMICASHSDHPMFKLKQLSETKTGSNFVIETERYGGMVHYSWLDRPLSIAGRVLVKTESGVRSVLIDLDRDLISIPSVAIHLNRTVNDGYKFNPATDLRPLFGDADAEGKLIELIANEAGVKKEDIISHDLYVYNRDEGRLFGANNEFFLAPALDDLESVYTSTVAFLNARDADSIPVLAIFDNEEVGSETKQGAASTFLADTLKRIAPNEGTYRAMLTNSLMLSADNAHARHPNHGELADALNAPAMNGGVVVKYNASQRYATDGVSDALFRTVCDRAGVPVQSFYNRADLPGGSTLGSISNTVVPVSTVDIGLAQLAMHCATETAGSRDPEMMIKAITEFYSSAIRYNGNEYEIK